MKNEDLKEISAALRELSLSYEEFGIILNNIAKTAKPLKNLIGKPRDKSEDSRLVAAGIALIAFPDPTITDLIGASLVIAGLMKNRMRQTTVADIYIEFQDTVKEIREYTNGSNPL